MKQNTANEIPFETVDRPEIPLSVVVNLIEKQFPEWSHLPIEPVEKSGWDNRTFHLGNEMLIRIPSAERYIKQVPKEQEWLPKLASHLPVPIPEPLGMGEPSVEYPWHWLVYRWIEGKNAETLHVKDFNQFALDIAAFLKELHKVDTTGAPVPTGPGYRGAPPVYYDAETRNTIAQLKNVIDIQTAISVWEDAITSEWNKEPVWVHGDFSGGNILVKDGRLTAVIDFGSTCVGDPSCDLVISWTLLDKESRKIFKSKMNLDSDTWARARGWALWKALITLAPLEDKNGPEALKQKKIINEILEEYKTEAAG